MSGKAGKMERRCSHSARQENVKIYLGRPDLLVFHLDRICTFPAVRQKAGN